MNLRNGGPTKSLRLIYNLAAIGLAAGASTAAVTTGDLNQRSCPSKELVRVLFGGATF